MASPDGHSPSFEPRISQYDYDDWSSDTVSSFVAPSLTANADSAHIADSQVQFHAKRTNSAASPPTVLIESVGHRNKRTRLSQETADERSPSADDIGSQLAIPSYIDMDDITASYSDDVDEHKYDDYQPNRRDNNRTAAIEVLRRLRIAIDDTDDDDQLQTIDQTAVLQRLAAITNVEAFTAITSDDAYSVYHQLQSIRTVGDGDSSSLWPSTINESFAHNRNFVFTFQTSVFPRSIPLVAVDMRHISVLSLVASLSDDTPTLTSAHDVIIFGRRISLSCVSPSCIDEMFRSLRHRIGRMREYAHLAAAHLDADAAVLIANDEAKEWQTAQDRRQKTIARLQRQYETDLSAFEAQQQSKRTSEYPAPSPLSSFEDAEDVDIVDDERVPRPNAAGIIKPADYSSWDSHKRELWNRIAVSPNDFWYEYGNPTVPNATSEWTSAETLYFIQLCATHKRVHEDGVDLWGLFAVLMYGRTGKQCRQKFAQLSSEGRIIKFDDVTGIHQLPDIATFLPFTPLQPPANTAIINQHPRASRMDDVGSSSTLIRPQPPMLPPPIPPPRSLTVVRPPPLPSDSEYVAMRDECISFFVTLTAFMDDYVSCMSTDERTIMFDALTNNISALSMLMTTDELCPLTKLANKLQSTPLTLMLITNAIVHAYIMRLVTTMQTYEYRLNGFHLRQYLLSLTTQLIVLQSHYVHLTAIDERTLHESSQTRIAQPILALWKDIMTITAPVDPSHLALLDNVLHSNHSLFVLPSSLPTLYAAINMTEETHHRSSHQNKTPADNAQWDTLLHSAPCYICALSMPTFYQTILYALATYLYPNSSAPLSVSSAYPMGGHMHVYPASQTALERVEASWDVLIQTLVPLLLSAGHQPLTIVYWPFVQFLCDYSSSALPADTSSERLHHYGRIIFERMLHMFRMWKCTPHQAERTSAILTSTVFVSIDEQIKAFTRQQSHHIKGAQTSTILTIDTQWLTHTDSTNETPFMLLLKVIYVALFRMRGDLQQLVINSDELDNAHELFTHDYPFVNKFCSTLLIDISLGQTIGDDMTAAFLTAQRTFALFVVLSYGLHERQLSQHHQRTTALIDWTTSGRAARILLIETLIAQCKAYQHRGKPAPMFTCFQCLISKTDSLMIELDLLVTEWQTAMKQRDSFIPEEVPRVNAFQMITSRATVQQHERDSIDCRNRERHKALSDKESVANDKKSVAEVTIIQTLNAVSDLLLQRNNETLNANCHFLHERVINIIQPNRGYSTRLRTAAVRLITFALPTRLPRNMSAAISVRASQSQSDNDDQLNANDIDHASLRQRHRDERADSRASAEAELERYMLSIGRILLERVWPALMCAIRERSDWNDTEWTESARDETTAVTALMDGCIQLVADTAIILTFSHPPTFNPHMSWERIGGTFGANSEWHNHAIKLASAVSVQRRSNQQHSQQITEAKLHWSRVYRLLPSRLYYFLFVAKMTQRSPEVITSMLASLKSRATLLSLWFQSMLEPVYTIQHQFTSALHRYDQTRQYFDPPISSSCFFSPDDLFQFRLAAITSMCRGVNAVYERLNKPTELSACLLSFAATADMCLSCIGDSRSEQDEYRSFLQDVIAAMMRFCLPMLSQFNQITILIKSRYRNVFEPTNKSVVNIDTAIATIQSLNVLCHGLAHVNMLRTFHSDSFTAEFVALIKSVMTHIKHELQCPSDVDSRKHSSAIDSLIKLFFDAPPPLHIQTENNAQTNSLTIFDPWTSMMQHHNMTELRRFVLIIMMNQFLHAATRAPRTDDGAFYRAANAVEVMQRMMRRKLDMIKGNVLITQLNQSDDWMEEVRLILPALVRVMTIPTSPLSVSVSALKRAAYDLFVFCCKTHSLNAQIPTSLTAPSSAPVNAPSNAVSANRTPTTFDVVVSTVAHCALRDLIHLRNIVDVIANNKAAATQSSSSTLSVHRTTATKSGGKENPSRQSATTKSESESRKSSQSHPPATSTAADTPPSLDDLLQTLDAFVNSSHATLIRRWLSYLDSVDSDRILTSTMTVPAMRDANTNRITIDRADNIHCKLVYQCALTVIHLVAPSAMMHDVINEQTNADMQTHWRSRHDANIVDWCSTMMMPAVAWCARNSATFRRSTFIFLNPATANSGEPHKTLRSTFLQRISAIDKLWETNPALKSQLNTTTNPPNNSSPPRSVPHRVSHDNGVVSVSVNRLNTQPQRPVRSLQFFPSNNR